MDVGEELSLQIDIFSCLALNKSMGGVTANLDALDLIIKPEYVFYTCRALRRLLLGVCWYPVIVEGAIRLNTTPGEQYKGPGLIINSNGFYVDQNIHTQSYLQTIYSLEATDNLCNQSDCVIRAMFCHTLTFTLINPQLMFRIISRYLSMNQFEECFNAFVGSLKSKALHKICTQNYYSLLSHLKDPILTYTPTFSKNQQLEFYKFNIQSFVNDWPNLKVTSHIKQQIYLNINKYPKALLCLCRMNQNTEIVISTSNLTEFQNLVSMSLPQYNVQTYKKDPGNKPFKVLMREGSHQKWFLYPQHVPIYRVAMCMSVMNSTDQHRITHLSTNQISTYLPNIQQTIVSMFNKVKYAPRETRKTITLNLQQNAKLTNSFVCNKKPLCDTFVPVSNLSVYDFEINVFNTNMVINTKIIHHQENQKYKSILDIPRLINNFVVKKYSVKEPSFTVSVFYSDKTCASTAINMNISGDFLTFLFAMGNMQCFLPIKTILPISVSNWNSTMDLHGLENQQIVRCGRNDVFWTTNFPSAVSSKRGFNVSWFKAATATISKVNGNALISQVFSETTPILTNRHAKLNKIKNSIFFTLEQRNRAQIQTTHKRFLECLYECSSFMRLNVNTLLRLSNRGYFDFSKRIISHTKNKHECAVLGYKKCNLVPKVLCNKKKIRLDELGRNANFMTFISSVGYKNSKLKKLIRRHMLRTFGLSWKLHKHKM